MNPLLYLMFSFVFFGTNAFTTIDYTGEWEYKVDTPQGPYSGAIVLERSFDGYTGYIKSGDNQLELSNVVVEGNTMKFNIDVDGFPVTISGSFEGDTYTAVASVEGMEIPLVAKRKR